MLSAPAPASGFTVTLHSSDPGAAIVPSSVTVPAGQNQTAFTIQTSQVIADVAPIIMASAGGSVDMSATLTVWTMLRSVSVTPFSIIGGQAGTGTVTLGMPAPPGGAVVALSGGSTSASIPSSVTVPAGATSASFLISTQPVAASEWVSLLATYDGAGRNTMFEIRPAPDQVSIRRAEYVASKQQLRVEATSTSTSATLQVYGATTGQWIGTLSNLGGGKYGGQFSWPANPQQITVRSSLGGSATATVVVK